MSILVDVIISSLVGPVPTITALLAEQLLRKNAESVDSVSEIADTENDYANIHLDESVSKALIELAIAQRISNSDSVEIEEYYEKSMDGNASLKINKDSPEAGVGGNKQIMTKRILRFTGLNKDIEDIYEKIYKKDSEQSKVDKTLDAEETERMQDDVNSIHPD